MISFKIGNENLYEYDDEGKWVKDYTKVGGISLTPTGKKFFSFKNRRLKGTKSKYNYYHYYHNECSICGEKNNKLVLGNNTYDTICVKCAEKWIDESVDNLNELIKTLKERKQYLIDNKEQILKEEQEFKAKRTKIEMMEKLKDKDE